MLFYDWEYHDGIDIKGATKLKYYFEKSEGGWFRPKARIAMSGRFMVETEEGGGAIEFYKTDNEAIARYQGEVKRIREAA